MRAKLQVKIEPFKSPMNLPFKLISNWGAGEELSCKGRFAIHFLLEQNSLAKIFKSSSLLKKKISGFQLAFLATTFPKSQHSGEAMRSEGRRAAASREGGQGGREPAGWEQRRKGGRGPGKGSALRGATGGKESGATECQPHTRTPGMPAGGLPEPDDTPCPGPPLRGQR